jgi:hypothetical protein
VWRADEYKPTLRGLERILADAGLDAEDIRRGATVASGSTAGTGQNRNRR